MKVYTKMPRALHPFYKNELTEARNAFDKKHYQVSWRHLERAHILGQPYPYQHTAVHWKMFCFGIKLKNFKEATGQIPRLLVGGVKSFVGSYSCWQYRRGKCTALTTNGNTRRSCGNY